MSREAFPHRTPGTLIAGRYLERLSKALPGTRSRGEREFWPEGAKFVIAISLQFDGEPYPAPEGNRLLPRRVTFGGSAPRGVPRYVFEEGIPRLLQLFHKRRIGVTACMTAQAVERERALAREIVERGHEAALSRPASKEPLESADAGRTNWEAAVKGLLAATGSRPVGLDGRAPLATETLEVLQDLGFLYHATDLGRDEPVRLSLRGQAFAILPNGLESSESARGLSADQYASELRNEFDMLYSEAESRRRMMSIALHGGIAGRPARSKVLEEFIIYAQRRPGVVFLRREEIARFVVASALTPPQEEPLRPADVA